MWREARIGSDCEKRLNSEVKKLDPSYSTTRSLGSDQDYQIDIIHELDLANATYGITQVAGLHNGSKAFLFRDGYRGNTDYAAQRTLPGTPACRQMKPRHLQGAKGVTDGPFETPRRTDPDDFHVSRAKGKNFQRLWGLTGKVSPPLALRGKKNN
ncbi:hypothetical protein F2P81_004142 [Scophthalmus maximus]|uniref:Uncharacterized protein n=1 Tax=Scophthalmus maximus TaxID=52904 RepID=A0A6A4TC30_SCOMX|nr:hypothetical protein F2P81_004142 [Scophthalmus maximus]